jgi:hypothetical protein
MREDSADVTSRVESLEARSAHPPGMQDRTEGPTCADAHVSSVR